LLRIAPNRALFVCDQLNGSILKLIYVNITKVIYGSLYIVDTHTSRFIGFSYKDTGALEKV
jgi:hypothetical protein